MSPNTYRIVIESLVYAQAIIWIVAFAFVTQVYIRRMWHARTFDPLVAFPAAVGTFELCASVFYVTILQVDPGSNARMIAGLMLVGGGVVYGALHLISGLLTTGGRIR